MKKTITACLTAAAIAATVLAGATTDANARGGRWVGPAIIGGALLGAGIAAGAYAYPRAYYPVAGYEPYPVYSVRGPYQCGGGYWARRPVRDQWGNVVGYSRPRWFCPN